MEIQMIANVRKSLLAVALVLSAESVSASTMCDTLGDTAEGVAATRRDKGVSEQAVLAQVNEKKPGGLSDENRAMMVSLVHMVYARRDLTPEGLNHLATTACLGVPTH
jgi:hypothetical protein